MADQAAEEQLLDVRIAEASAGYKFYLNNEKLILGSTAVILFYADVGDRRQLVRHDQPDVHERAVDGRESRMAAICFG